MEMPDNGYSHVTLFNISIFILTIKSYAPTASEASAARQTYICRAAAQLIRCLNQMCECSSVPIGGGGNLFFNRKLVCFKDNMWPRDTTQITLSNQLNIKK